MRIFSRTCTMRPRNFQASALLFAIAVITTLTHHTACAQNSRNDFLIAHNLARAAVGVPPLSWNRTIATFAREFADRRKADCRLVHSGRPYGENVCWGSGTDFTGADAVWSWVEEKQFYDHHTNACAAGEECGSYTQVVWRNSVHLGCARVLCDGSGVFVVCNYDPPGNYIGERPY